MPIVYAEKFKKEQRKKQIIETIDRKQTERLGANAKPGYSGTLQKISQKSIIMDQSNEKGEND